jgi:hypothetical protein
MIVATLRALPNAEATIPPHADQRGFPSAETYGP